MKKILVIPLLLITVLSFSQTVPLLKSPNGHIYNLDTTTHHLNVQGTYLLTPNDSTINFDSTKVGVTLTKNATRDSIQLRNGAGVVLSTVKDSTGGGGGGGIADTSLMWSLVLNSGVGQKLGLKTNNTLNIYSNNLIKIRVDSATQRTLLDSVPISRGGATALGNQNLTNIAIGDSALYLNTTGNHNIGIGYQVLARSLTASSNTALGYRALNATTGGLNTAVGDQAMLSNIAGTNNTAVGSSALNLNTSGIKNTAIGESALSSNLTTNQNVAVGYFALKANIATGNTAVGESALAGNTSGSLTTAVGQGALTANTTGAQNTAVGQLALGGLTTGANGNTALGVQAGKQLAGSALYNTFVGAEYTVNKGLTAGSNNTWIGANILSPSATMNTTAILATGDGIWRIYSNSTRQTGIINRNPSATLTLQPGRATQFGAPLKIPFYNLATTAATGNGSTATLTFAAQPAPPFSIGDTIIVAGVTPAGYNNTAAIVTASTTTTVSYTNGTTGAQTVAGTVSAGALLTIPESGAIETDGTHIYWTDSTGTRKQLD